MGTGTRIACVAVWGSVAGCGDSPTGLFGGGPPIAVRATALVLEPGDTLRVGFVLQKGGQTFETPPYRYPEPGDPGEWTSRDPAVATVEGGGLVTARASGVTRVVVRVGSLADSATVTVRSFASERSDYSHVAVGDAHACALTAAGDAYCWGSNWYGALGIGAAKPYTAYLSPVRVAGGERYTALAAGNEYTCGLTNDGRVLCWGNRGGAAEPTLNALVPTAVATSLRFTQLTAGANHTCALTSEGRAYCWGANFDGQLGTGNRTPSAAPQPVGTDVRWASISAGTFHTCAVSGAGGAYCWGDNASGQLGLGASSPGRVLAPAPVASALSFQSIAAGTLQTCAVSQDARAACWGFNSNGQLGTGDREWSAAPRFVLTDLRFSAISVRREHACAVAVDGSGYCWGGNKFGALGNGVQVGRVVTPTFDPYTELKPTLVRGGHAFTSIGAGFLYYSCGRATDGRLFCWGNNDRGQLGTGRQRLPVDTEYPVTTAVETEPALVRRP